MLTKAVFIFYIQYIYFILFCKYSKICSIVKYHYNLK